MRKGQEVTPHQEQEAWSFDFNEFRSTAATMKQKIFEAVEELQLRRANETENEEKINILLRDKYETERKNDEEIVKLKKSVCEADERVDSIRREFEEKGVKDEKDDGKETSNMHSDLYIQEIKALKDEIIALQLCKYNIEKKVREQERMLKKQSSTKDTQCRQIASLEHRCKSLEDERSKLDTKVSNIESKVLNSMTLQRKLVRTNEHKKCVIKELKMDASKQKELFVQLKAEYDTKLVDDKNIEHFSKQSIDVRDNANTTTSNLVQQYEIRMQHLTEENEALLDSQKKSSEVIQRISQRLDVVTNSETMLQFHVDELKQELESVKRAKHSLVHQLRDMKEKYDKETARNTLQGTPSEVSSVLVRKIDLVSREIQCSMELEKDEKEGHQSCQEMEVDGVINNKVVPVLSEDENVSGTCDDVKQTTIESSSTCGVDASFEKLAPQTKENMPLEKTRTSPSDEGIKTLTIKREHEEQSPECTFT